MVFNDDLLRALKAICSCKNRTDRKRLLAIGGPKLQKALREIAYNVLKGKVPLTAPQLKKLKSHKTGIRALAAKKTSLKKRLITQQRGGILSALLLPVLSSLAGSVVRSVIR